MPSSKTLRAKKKKYYQKNVEKIKTTKKEGYIKVASDRKARFKLYYQENKEHMKKNARASSKASYRLAPEEKKAASRATSKAQYQQNPERKQLASKSQYKKDPEKKNSTTRVYYSQKKESICAFKRDKYALIEPKPAKVDAYLKQLQNNLLGNTEAKSELIEAFR
jgi:hypothetical protein